MIRVLLVDDHQLVRQGLRSILEADGRFEVVGEASSGREAVNQVKKYLPEIIILDLKLKDISGAEVCSQIKDHSPNSVVLILTGYFEYDLVYACMQAGARGYLIKDAEELNLPDQLIELLEGHAVLDPRAVDALTSFMNTQKRVVDALTPRELEIIRLISQGLSNQEISLQLNISINTTKSHIKELFSKLDAHNRIEAVVMAKQRGLL